MLEDVHTRREVFDRLPSWLLVFGIMASAGTLILAARFVWEETVWTWERGPQMIGFSLAHGPGVFLLLFPLILILWIVLFVVLVLRNVVKKKRIARRIWVGAALLLLPLVILMLPERFWQRAFIARMASSPRAGDLLMTAAGAGDRRTVKAFISHGVPVDAKDKGYWMTAMHAAAAKGDVPTLQYLVSVGANIDALDRSGDSPLELAISNGHDGAAKFLTEQGAKRIRGDEAQRQKAIQDQADEVIRDERTN